MILHKLPIKSNASRNINTIKFPLMIISKHKKLSFYRKWLGGSGKGLSIIFRKRSSRKAKSKLILLNYNNRFNNLAIISNFCWYPTKNKLTILLSYSNGMYMSVLMGGGMSLFDLISKYKNSNLSKIALMRISGLIINLKHMSIISSLEARVGLGAIYCRANGSKIKILSIDRIKYTSLIVLPSKVRKVVSVLLMCRLGCLEPKDHKNMNNTKSGYWRALGIKSTVRGVAKNPVDHPHGGRTKSIKYPRTPWGKTTKFK